MSADMKGAAAGLTLCDLCDTYVTNIQAHGINSHLGNWLPLRRVNPGDTILYGGETIEVGDILTLFNVVVLTDIHGRQHPLLNGVDGPVRVISTADHDARRKVERDENWDWDGGDW